MNQTRTLWAWRAALARRAAPDPRRLQRAMALERALIAHKPWLRQNQLCFGPFLPSWPGPAHDRWILDAWSPSPSLAPWRIVDADGSEGRAAARAVVSAEAPLVLVLRGDQLAHDPDELVALVAEAAVRTEVWLLTSGRRLTASTTQRLSEAGLRGAAIGFFDAKPEVQDQVWGRRSWDDAATALGLFAQANLPTAMLVEAQAGPELLDRLRGLHPLARELSASFLAISAVEFSEPLLALVQRNQQAAFSDYPGVTLLGPAAGAVADHALAQAWAQAPRPRPANLAPAVEEPEVPLTGLDLPEPPPTHQHRGPTPIRVTGGVVEALRRRLGGSI